VETSRPLIDERAHILTITLPPAPILLEADFTRLAQVFSNLLNNAAKYSEPGGRIRLSAERNAHEILVRISDTGIGIPASDLPHVFEMFTQVDTALERSQGGLGIGLSLVKGLVDMHGGAIEVRSEGPGRGSEFVVRLPVVKMDALPGAHPADADRKSSFAGRWRVLVIDDNRLSAESAAMALRLMGHEITTAYDGIEGIEVAKTFKPDVILLDIGLPKLSGYETARRLREQSWGKSIVLIAVTGYGQDEDRQRALAAGFDYHMVKPVNFGELEQKLSEMAPEVKTIH
jgi:CheY-like chemotaxis protein/anti-sigma regulatory factor (Ser/Thr protein kinase)